MFILVLEVKLWKSLWLILLYKILALDQWHASLQELEGVQFVSPQCFHPLKNILCFFLK